MMKRLLALCLTPLLLISISLSFYACVKTESKEITCEEIITAYEEAGYSVLYHGHENDTMYNEDGIYCSFEIRDPYNEDNYMYVHRYFSEEDAKTASKERRFNPILWFFFGIFGEWRWLHVRCYGDIEYETFDYKIMKPLENLTK